MARPIPSRAADGRPPCFDCDELLNPALPRVPPFEGRAPTEAEAEEVGQWFRERYAAKIRSSTANEIRGLAAALVPALKRSLVPSIIGAVVGFAFGFVVNVYLMAAKHDGFNVPNGSVATGVGNPIWGPTFWAVASSVAGVLVGMRLRAGKGQFWGQVVSLPKRLQSTMRKDGDRAAADLLWGISGSMLVAASLPPSMGGVAAAALIVVLGTALKRVAAGVLMAGWQWVAQRVNPNAPIQSLQGFEVAVLGSAVGMAFSYVAPASPSFRVLLAVVAAGAAVALRKGMGVGKVAVVVLIGLAAAAVLLSVAHPALADDGGYPECGRRGLWNWLTSCTGSRRVIGRGIIGGIASLLGPLVGIPVGTLIPEMVDEYFGEDETFGPEDDFPGSGGCDGDSPTSGAGSAGLTKHLRRNPDAPLDDSWLLTRTLKNAYKDYNSGDMIVRMETMARDTPGAAFQVLMDEAIPIGKGLIDAKAYMDSGKPEQRIKDFFNRPAREVNRDLAQSLINFQQGNDPFTKGVRSSAEKTMADLNQFKADYLSALDRNDQQALGRLHAKANANVGYQIISNVDLPLGAGQLPFKGMGTGAKSIVIDLTGKLRPGALRTRSIAPGANDVERALLLDAESSLRAGPNPSAPGPGSSSSARLRPPPVVRPRAEIEGALERAMRDAPEGSIVRVSLSPEEVEAFNVNRMTALNLYETGLQHGTFVHMKQGEAYGPTVRAANPDGVFKPNSMGAKSLTPEEASFLGVDPNRRGAIYHYKPTKLPDPGDPSFSKVQFRMQNYKALDAEMTTLRTKGGYGVDENGVKYHYKVDVERDGRVVMVERNGQPVDRRPFIIDEDTADWGSAPARRIAVLDDKGVQLLDANGKPQFIELDSRSIPDDVQQAWLYKQSHGRIAGEGRTRAWVIDPNDPYYAGDMTKLKLDLAKKSSTLEKLAAEGHVLIDGDGIFLCKVKPKKGKPPKKAKSPSPRAPKSIKATKTNTTPPRSPAPRRTK